MSWWWFKHSSWTSKIVDWFVSAYNGLHCCIGVCWCDCCDGNIELDLIFCEHVVLGFCGLVPQNWSSRVVRWCVNPCVKWTLYAGNDLEVLETYLGNCYDNVVMLEIPRILHAHMKFAQTLAQKPTCPLACEIHLIKHVVMTWSNKKSRHFHLTSIVGHKQVTFLEKAWSFAFVPEKCSRASHSASILLFANDGGHAVCNESQRRQPNMQPWNQPRMGINQGHVWSENAQEKIMFMSSTSDS